MLYNLINKTAMALFVIVLAVTVFDGMTSLMETGLNNVLASIIGL